MKASTLGRSLALLATAALLLGADHARDKSKPVRAALNAQYATLANAWHAKDTSAVLALRHPSVFAVQASGAVWDASAMAGYTRAAFAQVETTLVMSFDLDTIDVHGDTAAAIVDQHWVRRQQKAGSSRWVDTRARQRETWVRVDGEWRMWRVDRVVPGIWVIDGKRVDPSKPYDPDAPAFVPESDAR